MSEQLDIFSASVETHITEEDIQKAHDDKNKRKKLTSRQWALLNLIKHNSIEENRKTTQKEICEKLGDYGYNYVEKNGENHDHCSAIWQDIAAINLSYETDKLIISDKFVYHIGNEQETKGFIDKLWNDLEPRLVRYWAYLQKISRDGQGQLLSRKLQPIDDNSKARDYIESFRGS